MRSGIRQAEGRGNINFSIKFKRKLGGGGGKMGSIQAKERGGIRGFLDCWHFQGRLQDTC